MGERILGIRTGWLAVIRTNFTKIFSQTHVRIPTQKAKGSIAEGAVASHKGLAGLP
jgi:hypothetical protein